MEEDNSQIKRHYVAKQPPPTDEELIMWRQMSDWFQSGKAIIRFGAWVFVAVGGVVAIVGGIINIVHQNGGR